MRTRQPDHRLGNRCIERAWTVTSAPGANRQRPWCQADQHIPAVTAVEWPAQSNQHIALVGRVDQPRLARDGLAKTQQYARVLARRADTKGLERTVRVELAHYRDHAEQGCEIFVSE